MLEAFAELLQESAPEWCSVTIHNGYLYISMRGLAMPPIDTIMLNDDGSLLSLYYRQIWHLADPSAIDQILTNVAEVRERWLS